MELLVFWALSFVILGTAIAVVFLDNIIHCALFLILTFIGVAGIYLTLSADFIAIVQILVYAGAVSILIVFSIMLVSRNDGSMKDTNPLGMYKWTSGIISAALFSVISFFIIKTPWDINVGIVTNSMEKFAEVLLSDYVLSFELAAILLLVALVGAIIIAREVKES
ncbi:NADH dehydrogenase subunit J [Desulfonispora thiosulfatigenes DSM 11270]|uniref:NADH-quinone oxidoreductase subunit J n=1 Tax=Desulfonispora thiosulfatigenes DSM 11270 TaxID=656914 RepID=A0A1W1VKV2_DESTI|nr:NADH-quinone oxidoreductase subunit J [Desulfonispora thiosulfatigenes]SMB93913.1 NADH dehydrogenase subunit J [Desulfonispora thiosulfatigenes DSM 11270]